MQVYIRTGVLALVAFVIAQAPTFAAQPYDGQWSVEVITEKGSCDRAYRRDLKIADGHVAAAADMPAKASGSVSAKGVVAVNFARGDDKMVAKGAASGNWASGEWSAPSMACSGRWRAEKRA